MYLQTEFSCVKTRNENGRDCFLASYKAMSSISSDITRKN